MNARLKSSLLWGVVGALAFLVLVQGYRLALGPLGVGPVVIGAVAVIVGALSAGFTHLLEPRLHRNGRS